MKVKLTKNIIFFPQFRAVYSGAVIHSYCGKPMTNIFRKL
jgi:hypothetical protein